MWLMIPTMKDKFGTHQLCRFIYFFLGTFSRHSFLTLAVKSFCFVTTVIRIVECLEHSLLFFPCVLFLQIDSTWNMPARLSQSICLNLVWLNEKILTQRTHAYVIKFLFSVDAAMK